MKKNPKIYPTWPRNLCGQLQRDRRSTRHAGDPVAATPLHCGQPVLRRQQHQQERGRHSRRQWRAQLCQVGGDDGGFCMMFFTGSTEMERTGSRSSE